jgi:hypothetical protein
MSANTTRGPEWFETRVSPEPNTGCWLWTGWLDHNGYGQTTLVKGKNVLVHRLSYASHVGPVPVGLVIDHKCRVRSCVNPDHLRAVTQGENVRCGISPSARHAVATHCVNGHAFTPENTQVEKRTGWRRCRACNRAKHQRRAAAKHLIEQAGRL